MPLLVQTESPSPEGDGFGRHKHARPAEASFRSRPDRRLSAAALRRFRSLRDLPKASPKGEGFHPSPRGTLKHPPEFQGWFTIVFLASLGLLEAWIFSRREFFGGDALWWLYYRFRSASEFIQALYSLDSANWYRPLSNRTISTFLYPFYGLEPHAYHGAVFVLFFLTTCVVYIFLRRLTGDARVAALGTTFFSLHSTNLYVTYDLAFSPELFYTSFYLLSLVFYMRWTAGDGTHGWYLASLGSFVMALMSKESAVTLPANLALITLMLGPLKDWRDFREWPPLLKPLIPFGVILAAYVSYVVLYLEVGAGGYVLAIHRGMV